MNQQLSQPVTKFLFAGMILTAAWTTLARGAATKPARDEASSTTQPSGAKADLTDLSLEDLMNVEVTSVTKEPQKLSNAPAAVTVIGQDDIQRSALGSIPELLRLVPGMDVARINTNSWAISSLGQNGYLADDLLVLMDGRSLYTPTFGGVTWNTVNYPLLDVDRIEAIRGPGSTLYGSNAVNGVVNITTKSARDTQGVLFDVTGGSQSDIGNVRYGGQIGDKTYYRVYSQYQYNGNGEIPNGDAAHDWSRGSQNGFRLDRYTSPQDVLTLQGDLYDQRSNEPIQTFPFPTGKLQSSDGGNLLGRWTHTESDQSDSSLQAYYDRQVSSNVPVGYEQDTLDIQYQNRFPLGANQEVTWGLGARDYLIWWLVDAPSVAITPNYQNEYIYNGFVQDQVSIVPDRLQWYFGTKLEYNDLTNLEIEPSTRLLWTPDNRNSIWGAVSRSTRIPSLYEESQLNVGGVPTSIANSPNAEATDSYEIGYKIQPVKPVTMDVTGFYNQYSGLIVETPNGLNPLAGGLENGADANGYGGAVSANWQVTPQCRLGASYNYLKIHAKPRTNSANAPFIPGSELRLIDGISPENQFQVHCYLDVLKNVQLNTSVYYVDSLAYFSSIANTGTSQTVPSYFRLDMNLHWQVQPNMTLAIGVQNLLQDRHYEFGSTNSPAVPTEVPRSFFAKWTMTF